MEGTLSAPWHVVVEGLNITISAKVMEKLGVACKKSQSPRDNAQRFCGTCTSRPKSSEWLGLRPQALGSPSTARRKGGRHSNELVRNGPQSQSPKVEVSNGNMQWDAFSSPSPQERFFVTSAHVQSISICPNYVERVSIRSSQVKHATDGEQLKVVSARDSGGDLSLK